ncbi:MAG: transporter [Mucilaginibacter sp.]|nr:transporter [Mucilaginibacter sp.]
MTSSIHQFKQAKIIVIVLLALGNFAAHAQEKITLQTAVDRALERNLTVKQAKLTESLGAADYEQSKNNILPSLNASPQASYNFGRSPNLATYSYSNQAFLYLTAAATMSVTLYQGGQLRNQIIENKLTLDVDKSNTTKVKNDLTLNVVTDYLQILTNQDLVTAAKQQIDIANQTRDRAQISFNVGNMTLADLAQAKAQVSTANLNLTTAQNQLDLSILILKQYMEMDPNADIIIEKPDISKLTNVRTAYSANEVIGTAIKVNPDMLLAEAQQQTYAQAIKIAKGTYYPTISLFGSVGSNYSNLQKQQVVGSTLLSVPVGTVQGTNQVVVAPVSQPVYGPYPFTSQFGNNLNQAIGINMQIPIFNRYLSRTNVKKAKLNYQNAEISTQIVKNNLSKTIIQAILDLQAAEKQYQSATQTFESNKEALNVTKQRYDVGLVNTLDYNTSLTNYNKSQNDMIQAQYAVIFRSKIIDYYLGNTITL